MRYILILISVLLFSISYSQTKYDSGIVKYGVKFDNDINDAKSDSLEKSSKKVRSFLNRLYEVRRKFYAQDAVFIELNFNQNSYYAKPVEVMLPESISKYSNMVSRNHINYGNINENLFLFHIDNSLGNMIIKSHKNYTWEITNDYKTIAGYKCRKAVLKKESNPKLDYQVWFTPQIPVAFTPVRYHGLPGATLGIKTPRKYIYAKDIKFTDNVTIKKPSGGKKISFKEYRKMITRFKPD